LGFQSTQRLTAFPKKIDLTARFAQGAEARSIFEMVSAILCALSEAGG
jgi:hypothetical protein